MFNPFSGAVLVRGEVVAKEDDSLVIKFQQSNAFWDESDIGDIGNSLVLQDAEDSSNFKIGDTIIAKGSVEQKGSLSTTQVTKSHFQPFGIDWKVTAMTVVILVVALFTFFVIRFLRKENKLILLR